MIAYDLPDEPITKGRVRMRVPVGGLTLIPDPNDPGKCNLEQIIEADLGGTIPQWVWALAIK